MPLAGTRRINEQAILFPCRRGQTQPTPDSLKEKHLTFGRPCQDDTINTRLIKAFGQDHAAHQGVKGACSELSIDGMPLVNRRSPNDRGRAQAFLRKARFHRIDDTDRGTKDDGAAPYGQLAEAAYNVLWG